MGQRQINSDDFKASGAQSHVRPMAKGFLGMGLTTLKPQLWERLGWPGQGRSCPL